jgi:uronate dehydrogenase
MTFNIMRTAVEEGLKRAIVFSSNHAAGYYEELIQKGVLETVTEDMVPYAISFYGWSKICQEALGHMFASGCDTSGRKLEVVMIRFGAPRTDLIENVTGDSFYTLRRHFGSYMSEGDELRMLKLCIEKEDIRDANGIPFQLFYGTSDNQNRIWSLRNAIQFGYEPQDSSYMDFPERIKKLFSEAIDKETVRNKGEGKQDEY